MINIHSVQMFAVSASALMLMGFTAPCPSENAGPAPAVLYDALGDGNLWFRTENEATRSCPYGNVRSEGFNNPKWVCHFNEANFTIVDGRWVRLDNIQ